MKSLASVQTVPQPLIFMAKGTIELLPNILVFSLFWIIAKFSRRFMKNFTKCKKSRNLDLILARLSQNFN